MAIRGRHWAVLALAAALAACRPSQHANDGIEVGDAWARATAPGQEVGAVYLTIHNGTSTGDRLLGGSSPAAQAVEIHSMRIDGAIMRMRRQHGLDIPGGGSAELSPGGTHLMLVGLKAPLAPGASVALSLDFAQAGRKDVVATVEPIGASGLAKGKR